MSAPNSMLKRARKDITNYKIQVFPRLRPPINNESKQCPTKYFHINDKQLTVVLPHGSKRYMFEKIFNADTKQTDIFNHVVVPFLQDMLIGYNCTILTYGQSGSGKSYTMVGPEECLATPSHAESGFILRTMEFLLNTLNDNKSEFIMHISYVELNKDTIIDLFAKPNAKTRQLRMIDDKAKKGSVVIQGVEEVPIREYDDFVNFLKRASELSQITTTAKAQPCNKSHYVFTLKLSVRDFVRSGVDCFTEAKLMLVDLAGTDTMRSQSNSLENVAKSHDVPDLSIQTFNRTIQALQENVSYVPYKDSKLTRLLQDSFSGKAKIAIVATLCPTSTHLEQTIKTLELVSKARSIVKKIQINQELNSDDMLKRCREDMDRLRQDLKAAKAKSGVYVNIDNYNALTSEMKQHRSSLQKSQEQCDELAKRLLDVQHQKDELEETFTLSKSELANLQDSVHSLKTDMKQLNAENKLRAKLIEEYEQAQAMMIEQSVELSQKLDRNIEDRNLLRSKVDGAYNNTEHNQKVVQKLQSTHTAFSTNLNDCLASYKQRIEEMQGTEEDEYSRYCNERTEAHFTMVSNMQKLIDIHIPNVRDITQRTVADFHAIQQLTDEQKTIFDDIVAMKVRESEEFINSLLPLKDSFVDEYTQLLRKQEALIEKEDEEFSERMHSWKSESMQLLNTIEEQENVFDEFFDEHSNPDRNDRTFELCKLLEDTLTELLEINEDEQKEIDSMHDIGLECLNEIERREESMQRTISDDTAKYFKNVETIQDDFLQAGQVYSNQIEGLAAHCEERKAPLANDIAEIKNVYETQTQCVNSKIAETQQNFHEHFKEKVDECDAVLIASSQLRADIDAQIEQSKTAMDGFAKDAAQRQEISAEECQAMMTKVSNILNEMKGAVRNFEQKYQVLHSVGDTPDRKEHVPLLKAPKVSLRLLEEIRGKENVNVSMDESFDNERATRMLNYYDSSDEGEYRGKYVSTKHVKKPKDK